MKLFFKYLGSKWRTFAALTIFVLIFIVSFLLYRLPVVAVAYPLVLCAVIGTAFLIFDFSRVLKLHDKYVFLQRLADDASRELPRPDDIPEEDLRELVVLLEKKISEIKNEDFTKFSDMVEYYTVWAHQIKTPIAAMKLTLQNEDTPLSRRLSAELFRIEQYVEMVLTFLRLDGDHTDYVFREYSLDVIIKGAVKKYASEFIDRKLKLKYEVTDLRVVTDEKWLSFVVEQIISNALKYTHDGKVKICTEGEVLIISDTGIGIAPEDLPRVFDRGYTGYNGRSDKSASGIGLYLCRRICEKLGIGISVSSVIGEGTRVALDLSQYRSKAE